jgi:hypothetical protein
MDSMRRVALGILIHLHGLWLMLRCCATPASKSSVANTLFSGFRETPCGDKTHLDHFPLSFSICLPVTRKRVGGEPNRTGSMPSMPYRNKVDQYDMR